MRHTYSAINFRTGLLKTKANAMDSNSIYIYTPHSYCFGLRSLPVWMLLVWMIWSPVYSQTFTLNGSASLIGGNTYRLTADVPHQKGAIWSINRIDLTQSFDISFMAYFGTKDASGGHGLAFVLQKTGQQLLGESGNGMGYKGISPSVAFTFDTHEDIILGDPFYDHACLHRNGTVTHGPQWPYVQAIAGSPNSNIEDNAWHVIRVTWNPASTNFRLFFNNALRLNSTIDLINDIFGGNNLVWWGVTAATGTQSNYQEVNFHQGIPATIQTPLRFCTGDTVQVVAPPGMNFSWSPATGISQTNVRNPKLFPSSNTTYTVSYTDTLGNPQSQTIAVVVNALPVSYTLYVPSGDSSYCKGDTGVDISLTGSQTSVQYDLLLNGSIHRQDVLGNGSGISFGYQQPSGLYTCLGTDTLTGCSAKMQGSITVVIDSLPIEYYITGSGAYCQGGVGQLIELDGSEGGVNYTLYRGGLTIVNTVPGNGGSISLGYQQVAGNYTIRGLHPTTGCANWMHGSATVSILPLPSVSQQAFVPACAGSPPIALGGGSPLGGTYSGNGVLHDTLFGTHIPGNYPITYTYTNPANSCTNSATATFTLYPLPQPSLGADTSFCAGEHIALQTSQNYQGYAWSQGSFGSTISVNNPGSYRVTVTDTNGCSSSDTIIVSMMSLPPVHFPATGPFCVDATPMPLTGGSPVGGTYSGNGVLNNIFSPAITGPGTYVLMYSYIDPGTGCINKDSTQVLVNPLPIVQHPPLPALCTSNPPFQLSGGQPLGGSYTGGGVSGGYFYPSTGASTYNVNYSYTEPSTGCGNTTTFPITVHPLPVLSIPAFPVVCEGDAAITLPQGSPAGGTYSGIGVTGSMFTAVNGAGPYLIRYHYTHPTTLCSDSVEAFLHVRPLPALSLFLPPLLCEGPTPVNLTGGQPSGGTYAGNFVNGNQFTPLMAGQYPITYTYHDLLSTCQSSITDTLTVSPLPVVDLTSIGDVCVSHPPINLVGGTPPGGTFTGNGILSGVFYPGTGPGNYNLVYHFQDSASGCIDSASTNLEVHPLPMVTHPALPALCIDELPYPLNGGNPSGGWYTGAYVSGSLFNPPTSGMYDLYYHYMDSLTFCEDSVHLSTNVMDLPIVTFNSPLPLCASAPPFALTGGQPTGGTYGGNGVVAGIFDPSIGPGSYALWYAYEDALTHCRDTVIDTLRVYALPMVGFNAPGPFCLSSPDTLLSTGTPAGGIYGGNGMTGDTFSPSGAGFGGHQISYTITDTLTGCSRTAYDQIIVYPLPQLSMANLPALCINHTPIQLGGGSPAGGSWHGHGVVAGIFDPQSSGPGSFTITYTYSDPLTGCTDSISRQIQVWDLPLVALSLDTSLCNLPMALPLTGGSPAGGSYAGTGVISGSFNPVSGAGDYIILYFAEDLLTGCRDTAFDTLQVHPLPTLGFTAPADMCESNTTIILNGGTPVGGVYSGNGVSAGIFDPAIGPGTYILTYTYTNPLTTCSDSASDSLIIHPLPLVTIPALGPFCENDSMVLLPTGSPAGGTWSGSGVFGQYFDPGAGAGNHLISYTWQDSLTSCADTAWRTVIVNEVPQISFIAPGPYCQYDPPVHLNGGIPAGGTYSGNGMSGGIFFPWMGTGTFMITYTYTSPLSGCIAQDSSAITVYALPQVSAGPDLFLCEDTLPFVLQDGSPSGGIWEGPFTGAGIFSPPGQGIYELVYTFLDSLSNCSASDTLLITVMALPDPMIPTSVTLCDQDAYLVQVQGGYADYLWSDGSHNPYFWITQPGSYWVQVTDLNLCRSIPDTIEAVVFPLPDPGLPQQVTGCRNAAVVLEGALGMNQYLWQDGSSGREYAVYAPGVYWLEVTDIHGCTNRDSVSVILLPSPEIHFPPVTFLCDRPFLMLDASQEDPACTYYWNDGSTSAIREISIPGEYFVTVTNGQCQGWGYALVRPCAEIWAANAFTPNGDGINDLFRIFSSEPLISGRLLIMNRWGQIVFHSDDPAKEWDGNYMGQACPQEVYTWILDFVRDGLVPLEREGRRVGQVVLIR